MEIANKRLMVDVNPTIKRLDKVIIYGDNAVGKSASAATALLNAPAERRLVVLMSERNAVGGLTWGLKHYGVTPEEGQVVYVFPQEKKKAFTNLTRSVGAFIEVSKVDALKGVPDTNQNKHTYTYLINVLSQLEYFVGTDYLTGKEVKIGNVGLLDEHDILFIDGLSPLIKEVWNTAVGDKISVTISDYMAPQNLLYGILLELSRLSCHVVLYAHERNLTDPKGVLLQKQVNTGVGTAAYSSLMGLFTDVIHATKEGLRYRWEINAPNVHANSRRIPAGEKNIEPNFTKYGFFSNTD